MNQISLYIHTDEDKHGEWVLVDKLDFAAMDSSWMLEGKLPEEQDIVPWKTVTLPSGERIDLGVVFDDPAQCLSVYVKTAAGPILDLITKGHPCLRFISPAGTNISLQVHEGN
ncbi:MAG: hypothetical protein EOL86_09910 [Deltaproteobacteria bacterium]|nr:hypothetical protein [Deltaproteobacteria bacterium]